MSISSYLPLWRGAEETSLINCPSRNFVKRRADVQMAMFANMGVVQCAVSDFVCVVNTRIDVINRMAEFISNSYFSLPLFALFDQIENNNWTSVAFDQILKMQLCCRIGWVNSVQLNWGLWHCHATFLCPKCRNGPSHLQIGGKNTI